MIFAVHINQIHADVHTNLATCFLKRYLQRCFQCILCNIFGLVTRSHTVLWFTNYGNFAEWLDFAFWWSCNGKGLCLQPAQQACLFSFIIIFQGKSYCHDYVFACHDIQFSNVWDTSVIFTKSSACFTQKSSKEIKLTNIRQTMAKQS